MTTEFLITSLIIVLLPGTGVLYTVSTGLMRGWLASVFAAFGCTLGIIPHLAASIMGLAAILHASALAFQALKIVGVAYLLYLAWGMWKESDQLELDGDYQQQPYGQIALKAFLINILNPKLSIFFLAFLPQFVPHDTASPVLDMALLGAVFMIMTLVIFILYGLFAHRIRIYISNSPNIMRMIQRTFAGIFAMLGLKLASLDR